MSICCASRNATLQLRESFPRSSDALLIDTIQLYIIHFAQIL